MKLFYRATLVRQENYDTSFIFENSTEYPKHTGTLALTPTATALTYRAPLIHEAVLQTFATDCFC